MRTVGISSANLSLKIGRKVSRQQVLARIKQVTRQKGTPLPQEKTNTDREKSSSETSPLSSLNLIAERVRKRKEPEKIPTILAYPDPESNI